MTDQKLELWGGIECSVNRVGDAFYDQFQQSGHVDRLEDLERVAELGIRTLRYPVSWERICPSGCLSEADWRWTDARMVRLRDLGIRPIAGILHHGSGPCGTSLVDPCFPEKLAAFARAAAEQYPWITDWTPVNEPLTTARFAGLYAHWYPHGRDEATFAQAFLNQMRGTVLAMRAIRQVIPGARLVQTEDMGKTWSTPALAYQADFENVRRFLTFDLLCGRVAGDRHRMYGHLRWAGVTDAELLWFVDNPCPPDVIGVNHYVTSERFLDERRDRYPPHTHGANGRHEYADVEAVRVLEHGAAGPRALLGEVWERYRLPIVVTEAHLGCPAVEEQIRWLAEVWEAARSLDEEGADIRAVTVWALFGAYDWDSLLTRCDGRYEFGVFAVRRQEKGGGVVEPTPLAPFVRSLAKTGRLPEDHPTLLVPGWWRRPERLIYPPHRLCGVGHTAPHPMTRPSHRRQRDLVVA